MTGPRVFSLTPQVEARYLGRDQKAIKCAGPCGKVLKVPKQVVSRQSRGGVKSKLNGASYRRVLYCKRCAMRLRII